MLLNFQDFISKHITHREQSMFLNDILANTEKLNASINNKTVLVIGGAGTIGSSFIKALLPFNPKSLVVVDINENGLTELTRDLRSSTNFNVPNDYVTYPINYSDPVFKKMFVSRNGFDIVANFSAHKHVRSEKDKYSVEALIVNNVFHAHNLLELLVSYKPSHFFCVSTDKAANPVNIMGASKKIMENVIMSYTNKFPVTTARFANVAFSNGSLPAGFIERIFKSQPISAPSDVTRYFVSPQESGQICLLACILGETGDIFFPKLQKEQMLTFSKIATSFLNELGYEVDLCKTEEEALTKAKNLKSSDKKHPVYFSSSNTTGEKPYEEFYTDNEVTDMVLYKALGVIKKKTDIDKEQLAQFLDKMQNAFNNLTTDKNHIVHLMKEYLVNFDHKEVGKNLDSKM